jgi:hypothetical protein
MSVGKPVNGTFALKLVVGKSVTGYYVQRVEGAVFKLEKFSTDQGSDAEEREYVLNLADDEHGCSCKGFLRHSRCKHHDSLTALARTGRLEGVAA